MAPAPTRYGVAVLWALVLVASVTFPAPTVADPTTVAFEENAYGTERGDYARIIVNFAEKRSATLTLVGPNGDTANVTVSDGNRDWQATLLVNTYARADAGRFGTPNEADYTYVHDPFAQTGTLPAGEYVVRLRAGYGMESGVVDTVPLHVREPDEPNVTVAVAPEAAYDDLTSPAAVRRRPVTPRSTVAMNDTLVVRLDASGIEGALAVQRGATPTERFESLLAEPGFGLETVQTNPGASALEKHLRLFGPGTRFLADADNDTYYVVVDTGRVAVQDEGGPPVRAGDRYRVNATVHGRSTQALFRVVERDVSFVAPPETRFLRPAANQSVWLESTLAPGSRLRLAVEPTNAPADTGAVHTPVRAGPGRFAATVDATPFRPNKTLNVTVVEEGGQHGGEAGRVLARGEFAVTVPTASLRVTEVTNGGTATLAFDANVSHPSVVVAHRGNASGAVLGSTAVFPDDEDDTVSFEPTWDGAAAVHLVAYVDVDGDGEFDPAVDVRYPGEGAAVRSTVSPTVETTTTRTPEPTTTTGTSTPAPGFGVVATLLAVLLAALVGGTRRGRE